MLLELPVMVCYCFQIAGVNFGGAFIMITRTCPTSTPHIMMQMDLNRWLTLMTSWEECYAFRPFVRFRPTCWDDGLYSSKPWVSLMFWTSPASLHRQPNYCTPTGTNYHTVGIIIEPLERLTWLLMSDMPSPIELLTKS